MSEGELFLRNVQWKSPHKLPTGIGLKFNWSDEQKMREVLAIGDWVAIQFSEDPSNGPSSSEVMQGFPVVTDFQAQGTAFQSVNLKIKKLLLLAPCLDQSTSLSSSPEIQKLWSDFLKDVRQFFSERSFLAVSTPTLVPSPGTEPFLDVFEIQNESNNNKTSKHPKYYLPTSPELHLKKALSGGYHNIFEVRSCFRKGEISERHQPEFTMLEWYRSFCNLEDILEDCLHLISFITQQELKRSDVDVVSMAEVFQEVLGFHLRPQSSIQDLKNLARELGLHASVQEYQIWDDVFYQIFVEKIEPLLEKRSQARPLFLTKYPPSQAALARLTSDGWGDRFELYWKGMEIANAFHELNNPKIQAERFQHDLEVKITSGRPPVEIDAEFLQCLRAGMPPSAGIALGVERLFLCLHPQLKIQDLRLFPYRN